MKTLRNYATSGATLAACLACAVPAFAGSDSSTNVVTTRTTTVKYGDLNLASRDGVATLYGRLRGASREVCSDSSESSPGSRFEHLKCMHESLETAVKAVNLPALTALHTHGASPGLTAQR